MAEFPSDAKALKTVCEKLNEENQVLKKCLRLMRDNSALETASLLSAVVTFCDEKFRRKFADGLQGKDIMEHVSPKAEDQQAQYNTSDQTQYTFHTSQTLTNEISFTPDPSDAQSFPSQQDQRGFRHEVPVRDISPEQRQRSPLMTQEEIITQSVYPGKTPRGGSKYPHVSQGGRMMKSSNEIPYIYPSDPDSYHVKSHVQTCTPIRSDLEYDALYLRSLALAAGYRALAKGLSAGKEATAPALIPPPPFTYSDPDALCKTVAEIPPYIMYRTKRYPKGRTMIHRCVSPKPTKCYAFSREGVREPSSGRRTYGKKRSRSWPEPEYVTDQRALCSPLRVPMKHPMKYRRPMKRLYMLDRQFPSTRPKSAKRHAYGDERTDYVEFVPPQKRHVESQTSRSSSRERPPLKSYRPEVLTGGAADKNRLLEKQESDYDFQAVVTPIIDQARQTISEVTGQKPPEQSDITAFSLKHTHRQYKYQNDGTAVVQSDSYKKSYNWSSDEGDEGGAQKRNGDPSEKIAGRVTNMMENVRKDVKAAEQRGSSPSPPGSPLSSADSTGRSDHVRFETPSPGMDDLAHIDLADPEVQKAAVKIQSGFRGHLARQQLKEELGGSPRADRTNSSQSEEAVPRSANANQAEHNCTEEVPADRGDINLQTPNKTNNYFNERDLMSLVSIPDLVNQRWAVRRDSEFINHSTGSSLFRVVTPQPRRQEEDRHLQAPLQGSSSTISERLFQSPYSNSDDEYFDFPTKKMESSTKLPWLSQSRDYNVSASSHIEAAVSQKMLWADFPGKKMLGEVAFQLERRILGYVFANSLPVSGLHGNIDARQNRCFGYTVNNIGELINREALAGDSYSRGTERMLRERLRTLLDILTPMGYDLLDHGAFSQEIVNKYGLLERSPSSKCGGLSSEVGIRGLYVADIQNFIFSAAESDHERHNLLLIFDCLRMLAIEDGRPLFVW